MAFTALPTPSPHRPVSAMLPSQRTGPRQSEAWLPRWQNRIHAAVQRRTLHLPDATRGLMWAAVAGLLFTCLNVLMRLLSLHLDPFQTQFLRYVFGLLVLLPMVRARGLAAYRPQQVGGQFARGALPHWWPCACGFWRYRTSHWRIPPPSVSPRRCSSCSAPDFFFREPMRWDRWLATLLGFIGVLIVVGPKLAAGPGNHGLHHLTMLASAPLFAGSFLVTKALTRYENPGTILVWQAITVSLFSLPLALLHWQGPTLTEWLAFALCGALGTASHYCLTRSLMSADISATQSAKFLELVWAAIIGLAGVQRCAGPQHHRRRLADQRGHGVGGAPRVPPEGGNQPLNPARNGLVLELAAQVVIVRHHQCAPCPRSGGCGP